MRFIAYESDGRAGLAARNGDGNFFGCLETDARYPGDLRSLLGEGDAALVGAEKTLLAAEPVDISHVKVLPPVGNPEKIICIGLNYADHTAESGFEQPAYPTVFGRYNSTLIGHDQPIVRPNVSEQLDYEGELVAVIGTGGRHIGAASALDHVAGYSLFNDASLRDYQFKSPQWTMGKNFDSTGAFGPVFVSADELPSGCAGLGIRTRLNGEIVQEATIDDMIFDVRTLVHLLSEVMTLVPGDLIVTGTPSGAGFARKPPLWMRPDDVCEVEVDNIGTLRNPIVGEP